ncbi:MAG: hypothetical protein AB8H80_11875 [Planctomycetota bacterium]
MRTTIYVFTVAMVTSLSTCFAIGQTQPPDAAPLYRQAIAEMKAALGDIDGWGPDLPMIDDNPKAEYLTEEWVTLVDKSATARMLFEQATRRKSCRFDAKSASKQGEILDSLTAMTSLRELVAADAWQRLKKQPETTLRICEHLIDHAGHLGQDSSLWGTQLRFAVADSSILLWQAVLAGDRGASLGRTNLERALATIDRHRARRPTTAALAERCLADARMLLEITISEIKPERAAVTAAKERVLELVGELLAPLRTAAPIDVATLKKRTNERIGRWKAKLAGVGLPTILTNEVGETLAIAIATLIAPDVVGVVEAQQQCARKIDAVRQQLRATLDALPKRK